MYRFIAQNTPMQGWVGDNEFVVRPFERVGIYDNGIREVEICRGG